AKHHLLLRVQTLSINGTACGLTSRPGHATDPVDHRSRLRLGRTGLSSEKGINGLVIETTVLQGLSKELVLLLRVSILELCRTGLDLIEWHVGQFRFRDQRIRSQHPSSALLAEILL